MYTHTKTFEYTYSAHIPKQTDMQAQPTQVEVVIFTNLPFHLSDNASVALENLIFVRQSNNTHSSDHCNNQICTYGTCIQLWQLT